MNVIADTKIARPPTARADISPTLANQLTLISENCNACGLCVKQCRFLTEHGTPREIAESYCSQHQLLAFTCSLCNLCTAICPFDVDPSRMLLEMRREAMDKHNSIAATYKVIRNYEKRGCSPRFSYYGLPEGCHTIFFPGCTLPGTRPDQTIQLFEHLRKRLPTLGIVLDCCTKPSHDLGDEKFFGTLFDELRNYLLTHNIHKVIVACPNCHKVFKLYGNGLTVTSAYEELNQDFEVPVIPGTEPVTIHDPCAVRFETTIHDAVRSLINKTGLAVEEMTHARENTICCGEGGTVGLLEPKYAKKWSDIRKEEAGGRTILTYCAGCANFLNPLTPTSHLLDLLFDPVKTMSGKTRVSRTPLTYVNRLKLKRYFRKNLVAASTRERPQLDLRQNSKGSSRGSTLKRLGLLAALAVAVVAILVLF